MSRNKSSLTLLITVITLLLYGVFVVFAAPPGIGGYNPGETLNPECAPGDTVPEPCIVKFPLTTADNGLTVTGSNVQLGGTLLQDTVIDQDGNDLNIINGNFSFESDSDILGFGISGIALTYDTATEKSLIGMVDDPAGRYPALYYYNSDVGGTGTVFERQISTGDTGIGLTNTETYLGTTYWSGVGIGGSDIGLGVANQTINELIDIRMSVDNINPVSNGIRLSHENVSTTGNAYFVDINSETGVTFDSYTGGRYTFPLVDGTTNQVLATDGAGQISWADGGWSLSGNAGTTPGTNFLGTTDNKDLIFKTNNVQTGFISDDGLSIQFGSGAGSGSAAQSYTTYIGVNSGFGATGTSFSNFIGVSSGYQATNVIHSNFMGSAGFAATNADHSNFFGNQAGYQAVNASNSNFFGNQAGYQDGFIGAPVVNNSNFFGQEAGKFATNSSYSNFFGYRTGNGATNAANSIFIGSSAGYGDTVDNTTDPDDYSILIGNNSGTNGYENSIAIGAYATNTASNQFMIGSATRPINEVIIRGAGASCTIDNNIYGDGSTGLNCSSDERLKTNITPLSSVIDTLSHVETVTYNWKANPTGTQQIGFLAQNLEQYYPQLVQQGFDGYYQVNYAAMTPILVEAIREMNLKVTNLALLTTGSADTETFKNSLRTWFADAGNGITDFFTKTSHTETLCVGTSGNETCITKSQLDQLLNPQTIIQPSGDPETFDEPTPSDPEPDSTETSDTGSDESQDSTPISNDTNS
jgi:hypothetical protein